MKKIIVSIALAGMLFSCSKNPVTGRKQMLFLPESQMIGMSATAYGDFLNQNQQNVLPQSDERAARVTRIGEKITVAVNQYLQAKGAMNRVEGFNWQYNTVEDPTLNAWCMPGGMIVFYTGILELCQTDDEIAVIMGHEVAHAIARHGNERMSSAMAAQGITAAAAIGLQSSDPAKNNNLLLQAVGLGSQLGQLKFSRNHESEADKMGLEFMSLAGYDPYAAVGFWQKMSQQGGQKPPEILSTHPSDDRRIKDIEEYLIRMEAGKM